jgi:hypothetical protein
LASAGTVHFTVGSDDDAFVYVNGILAGQNLGIHALTNVTFAANENADVKTLEIFYADREQVAARLDVSADVTVTAAIPKPSNLGNDDPRLCWRRACPVPALRNLFYQQSFDKVALVGGLFRSKQRNQYNSRK